MCEKATRDEMEKEAIERLQILTDRGLHESVLDAFKRVGHDGENGLFYSESTVMRLQMYGSKEEARLRVGVLYWLDNDGEAEKLKDIVQRFEKKYDALAYMAIYGHYVYGGADKFEMLDIFFVSPYKEEWERDREDLNEGYAFCWTENITHPMLSEFGTIPYKTAGGGLVRDY